MKKLSTLLLFAPAACGILRAQTWEISVGPSYTRFGGQLLGSISEQNRQDDDTKLKGKYGYGARITINTPGYYGHEFSYFLNYADLTAKFRPDEKNPSLVEQRQDRVRIQEAAYNFLLYMMPKGERWRPYLTGGLQFHDYGAPKFAEWDRAGSRNYGANYGGGIKIKLFEHALIRADIRHYLGGKPYDLPFKDETKFSGGLLQQFEGALGLSIGF